MEALSKERDHLLLNESLGGLFLYIFMDEEVVPVENREIIQ